MVQLSKAQNEALADVRRFLDDDSRQVFRLFGHAGTGKSTIANLLAGDLKRVLYGAYTGKAALVMRQNGCDEATTVHRHIYIPSGASQAEVKRLELELLTETDVSKQQEIRQKLGEAKLLAEGPRFSLNPDSAVKHAELLVLDECSMIDERMGADLDSFGTKILVLGDPAQLPPVRGEGYYTTQTPDVLLTEIHRQAEFSPVIQLATTVRQGKQLRGGEYGDSLVGSLPRNVEYGGWDHGKIVERVIDRKIDQVLCGLNVTRQAFNKAYRTAMGYVDHLPQCGDRLVCLKNDHELGLLNGAQWQVLESEHVDEQILNVTITSLDTDDADLSISIHTAYFNGGKPDYAERDLGSHFDYAYAMTVHKSQGSQWPRVAVIDESRVFRNDAHRHLYTAITRAQEMVVVGR